MLSGHSKSSESITGGQTRNRAPEILVNLTQERDKGRARVTPLAVHKRILRGKVKTAEDLTTSEQDDDAIARRAEASRKRRRAETRKKGEAKSLFLGFRSSALPR